MSEFIEAVKVLGLWKTLFYRTAYRPLMRLAHRFNWHYAPPIYPDGDTMLWCKWCGFRDVIKRHDRTEPSTGPILRWVAKTRGPI